MLYLYYQNNIDPVDWVGDKWLIVKSWFSLNLFPQEVLQYHMEVYVSQVSYMLCLTRTRPPPPPPPPMAIPIQSVWY